MDEHLLSRLRHPAYVTPALPAGVLILDHTEVRRDMAEAADEIERLRAALTLISGFGGKCLFSNTRGSDGDQAYREGSHAAWEQAADIAASALKTADALNIHNCAGEKS